MNTGVSDELTDLKSPKKLNNLIKGQGDGNDLSEKTDGNLGTLIPSDIIKLAWVLRYILAFYRESVE